MQKLSAHNAASVAATWANLCPSLFVIVSLCTGIAAQAQSWREAAHEYLTNGNAQNIERAFSGDVNDVLTFITPYLANHDVTVHDRARSLVVQLTSSSDEPPVRKFGATLLAGVFHLQKERQRQILGDLTLFRKQDFTPDIRDSVRQWVKGDGPWLDALMKLAGFLGLEDLSILIHARTFPDNSQFLRWAALLSNARLGKAYAVTEIMMRVRKLDINDDVVYNLFPDLLYTRQSECVDYVVNALYSNARNCASPNADDDTPIPCAYRILEQLAPVISDFPVTIDEFGELETDDYDTALQQVRRWLKENRYTLNTDTF